MREFCIHLHKAENAARDVLGDVLAEIRERLNMPFDGIGVCKQDGIVPPGEFFPAYEGGEFFQRSYARVDIGNVRFHILPVGSDRIMKVRAVAISYFVQSTEHRSIIFGTEYYGVNFVGRELVLRNAIGKEGIARKDEALAEPFQQPRAIMVYNIRSCTDIYDHVPLHAKYNFNDAIYFNLLKKREKRSFLSETAQK